MIHNSSARPVGDRHIGAGAAAAKLAHTASPSPSCRCDEVSVLEDRDAREYARDHLRLDGVAPDAWSATWSCPATGWRWSERYFAAWRREEPTERLVRLDRLGGVDAVTPLVHRPLGAASRVVALAAAGLVVVLLLELVLT